MKKAIKKYARYFTAAVLTVLFSALFIIYGSADGRSNTVSSVKLLSRDRAEVSIDLADYFVKDNEGKTVYLVMLPSYAEEDSIDESSVIGSAEIESKVKIKAPLNGAGPNVKFGAALEDGEGNYKLITDMRYPDELYAASSNKRSFRLPLSKKGLSGGNEYNSYTEILSVSHTVIEADMASLILESYEDGAVAHVYKGISYWFDGEGVAALDRLVKEYSDRGVCVYIRCVLSDKAFEKDTAFLYAIRAKNEYARYYAPDIFSEKCYKYIESFYSFLGTRYTSPDAEHGFCASYIIGIGVNSNRIDRYFGKAKLSEYTENYAAELRLASNVLRSIYASSRLYVSVNNNFNAKSADLSYAGDELLDYSAKDLLEELNSILSKGGNIPWDLALDASPSEPAATDFWNDGNSLLSDDTLFITVRNLEVMSEFLSEESFFYNGKTRRIIIDRFSLSSDNDGSGEYLQAAAYAYAYYKAQNMDTVDAFIYSFVYDTEKNKSGIVAYDPFVEKEICNTLKYIDTDEKYRIYDNAYAYIGQESWDKLLPGVSLSKAAVKNSVSAESVTEIEISGKYYKGLLWSFTEGSAGGFHKGPYGRYIALEHDGVLDKTVMSCATGSLGIGEKGSIIRTDYGTEDIRNTGYISFVLKADGKGLISEELCLKIKGRDSSGNEIFYCGQAEVRNSTWTEVNFDIREFSSQCRKVESMELFFSPTGGLRCESGIKLSVSEVYAHTLTVKNAWMVLIWILLVLFIAAVAAAVMRNLIHVRGRNKQIRFDI